ncbi:MAG: hypothetical protein E7171_04485 [Firmicutes bacterium]|nr:hypothetical protein [Bacillota bacterium]
MKKELLNQIKQDKLFDYLKENTNYIKELNRNPSYYKTFKKEIKDKYKLNFSDKAKEVINDIELISNIISTIN